jgi:hypothetical protein
VFKPGQKIVCIRDTERLENWQLVLPNHVTKGTVYTVRSLHFEAIWPDAYGVRVEELINPVFNWDNAGNIYEWSFLYTRFRLATDITLFKNMLKREKEPA